MSAGMICGQIINIFVTCFMKYSCKGKILLDLYFKVGFVRAAQYDIYLMM